MTTYRAARLVRISDARPLGGEMDTAGVDRQSEDTLDLLNRLGWEDGGLYIENDTSAFKRRKIQLPDGSTGLRTVRPQFRRLLDDITSGAVTALIAYDLDRIARDPRDLEDLIDAVQASGAEVRSVTGSLDLSTDGGISFARVMVAMAAKSSMDTRRRVIRQKMDQAKDGLPSGGGARAYGYDRAGMEIEPEEGAVIRQMAAAVLAGDSCNAIAKRLTEQGIPTVGGAASWHHRTVSSILRSGRIAGLREYRGKGRLESGEAPPSMTEAKWPPILDRDTWQQVVNVLQGRPHGPGSSALQRWLSGVLVCGRCGHSLRGWLAGGRQIYWCSNAGGAKGCGTVSATALTVERIVGEWILAYLDRPDVTDALTDTLDVSQAASLRADIAADQAQLSELAEAFGRRDISMAEWLSARKPIDSRMTSAQQVVSRSVPGSVRSLLSAADRPARWAELGPHARRDVARAVFPDGITLHPATGRGPVFDVRRLVPVVGQERAS